MNAPYLLIDLLSGNVLSDFPSERDAWQALREMAIADGLESIAHLSLIQMLEGHPTLIAMEDEIVGRVSRETSQEALIN